MKGSMLALDRLIELFKALSYLCENEKSFVQELDKIQTPCL